MNGWLPYWMGFHGDAGSVGKTWDGFGLVWSRMMLIKAEYDWLGDVM